MNKVIIIGAGVSGITCGIELKKRGIDVLVLENLKTSLKKVLVTGNGRCNYWNENFSSSFFYSDDKNFINNVISEDNKNKIKGFFDSIGLVGTVKNGYFYPMSMQASSVRNMLLEEVKRLKLEIINDCKVEKVEKTSNGFRVLCNDKTFSCDNVVVACGSHAYYKEKSLGYEICKDLGHRIVPVLPSLVQLVGEGNYFKNWAGVRSNSIVSILVDNKKIKEEQGEIMLTDYGVSGICIFNISTIASISLNNNKKVKVLINFLPEINDLKSYFDLRSKTIPSINISSFLESLVNYKLVNTILDLVKIDKSSHWSDLSLDEKDKLCKYLSSFEVVITSTKSFDSAQVCSGGVDTREINYNTMESKIVPHLYVVGEVLDVVGDCGGYNLGFAFISGYIAGRSVKND
ncbi:MAG: aminoacetone oxidase family FAD-binding enzyme [Bacilli bacterium]|nr:aminoacetone oxidase family FAD-binding enzyme [Bacilli bacterium]